LNSYTFVKELDSLDRLLSPVREIPLLQAIISIETPPRRKEYYPREPQDLSTGVPMLLVISNLFGEACF
jgi:hypothetical protein